MQGGGGGIKMESGYSDCMLAFDQYPNAHNINKVSLRNYVFKNKL